MWSIPHHKNIVVFAHNVWFTFCDFQKVCQQLINLLLLCNIVTHNDLDDIKSSSFKSLKIVVPNLADTLIFRINMYASI